MLATHPSGAGGPTGSPGHLDKTDLKVNVLGRLYTVQAGFSMRGRRPARLRLNLGRKRTGGQRVKYGTE
ncbi:hypothetical protein QCA50_004757 [Cerrena zonata]|uniref:Uncharacterized protein n=1 Tax=Cerrena zonata TaxID=2478898 RepID=A0AAW0GP27_9APHY